MVKHILKPFFLNASAKVFIHFFKSPLLVILSTKSFSVSSSEYFIWIELLLLHHCYAYGNYFNVSHYTLEPKKYCQEIFGSW